MQKRNKTPGSDDLQTVEPVGGGVIYVGGHAFVRLADGTFRMLNPRLRDPRFRVAASSTMRNPTVLEKWRLWRASPDSKVIHILITCPSCGLEQILAHEIAADGKIQPSVVCHDDACKFHRLCKLANWKHGPYAARDPNAGL